MAARTARRKQAAPQPTPVGDLRWLPHFRPPAGDYKISRFEQDAQAQKRLDAARGILTAWTDGHLLRQGATAAADLYRRFTAYARHHDGESVTLSLFVEHLAGLGYPEHRAPSGRRMIGGSFHE